MVVLVLGGPRSCVPRVFDDSSYERRVEDPSQDQCQVDLLVREYGCCGPDQKGSADASSSDPEGNAHHAIPQDRPTPADSGGLWAALRGDDRCAIRIGCLSSEDVVILSEDSVL